MSPVQRTVHKYPLNLVDQQQITTHNGVEFLSVQEQNGVLCLWAAVNPGNPEKTVKVHIVGTGNPMPFGVVRFVGTVQETARPLVWHVFVTP